MLIGMVPNLALVSSDRKSYKAGPDWKSSVHFSPSQTSCDVNSFVPTKLV